MDRRKFLGISLGAAAEYAFGNDQKNPNEHKESAETKKETMSLDRATQFMKEGMFKVSAKEGRDLISADTCCIDGRWQEDENGRPPECAIPGADEGMLENLLAALNKLNVENLPAVKQKAIQKFIELKGGMENLHFHTDEHAEEDHSGDHTDIAKGCGHFKHSALNPEAYGLTPEDIKLIADVLEQATQDGAKREVLKGSHQETAVMIIEVEDLALKHETKAGQAFVYNKALHGRMLKTLAAEMSPDLGLNQQDLEKALIDTNDLQTNQSVTRLAKGLNTFSLKRNEKGLRIEYLGMVKVFIMAVNLMEEIPLALLMSL